MKNKKLIIILLTIIVTVIIVSNIQELIIHNDASLESKISYILHFGSIILSFIALPMIIYFAGRKAKKKVLKENLSKIDFKEIEVYYREILKNHTPLELSYIDNFEIDYSKDIIASLLSLQLKKKISIEDNYINIISDDINNLSKSEIYILNNIKDGRIFINSYEDILDCVKEEAVNNGLIIKNIAKRNDKNTNKYTSIFVGLMMMFITLFIVFFVFFNQELVEFLNNIVVPNSRIIIPIIIIFCLLSSFIAVQKFYKSIKAESYYQYKRDSYKRTKKGEELNYKIEGLKNYLNDFSSIDEKVQQELVLWEEYLIYSVIFNINTEIVNELSSLIISR